MTKKTIKTAVSKKQYVLLTRISYKSMLPDRRIIEPYYDEDGNIDPYHPDAPRVTLEHLGPADINLLIMRGILAEDK